MKRTLNVILSLLLTVFAQPLLAAPARPGETTGRSSPKTSRELDNLRAKQEAQQLARSMARELISSILEIQLAQLKENGLEKLPIYSEISSMRENIDKLVEHEMLGVVEVLVEAQSAAPVKRDEHLATARTKIREIVIRLSIERQNLLRRLKMAELAAQVRRLIQLESV